MNLEVIRVRKGGHYIEESEIGYGKVAERKEM